MWLRQRPVTAATGLPGPAVGGVPTKSGAFGGCEELSSPTPSADQGAHAPECRTELPGVNSPAPAKGLWVRKRAWRGGGEGPGGQGWGRAHREGEPHGCPGSSAVRMNSRGGGELAWSLGSRSRALRHLPGSQGAQGRPRNPPGLTVLRGLKQLPPWDQQGPRRNGARVRPGVWVLLLPRPPQCMGNGRALDAVDQSAPNGARGHSRTEGRPSGGQASPERARGYGALGLRFG